MPREHQDSIDQLEKLIGYEFRVRELCRTALTHGSRNANRPDYQRLEFLGDRVLSLIIAEELFKRYSHEQEGQMAARLSLLVRGETCAAVGIAMGLDQFILLGPFEKKKGVQRSGSVLGDVVESLIGALYLDGGLDVARGFILKQWEKRINAEPGSLKSARRGTTWAVDVQAVHAQEECRGEPLGLGDHGEQERPRGHVGGRRAAQ